MKKTFTKIICAALASVVALGTAVAAGCSSYYDGERLGGNYSEGTVTSNGGFAVSKGNYVYFINGVESNTANNDFGTPVKGSVMRISASDFAAHNYSGVQTVVPLVAYSGSEGHNGGLFIYGDYIYYSTPSTARNSEGAIQNSYLDMKRTKLDGTETMKNAYVTFPVTNYDYRYVEENGTVYLLYVATSEKLYEESTGVTNLHSYNTVTGENTLLAYNISGYLFDSENKSNPRVYYTMDVKNYSSGSDYGYNQVYTVTASETEKNDYDFASIIGWDSDNDRYINCGKLVYDGRGRLDDKTPFNFSDETNLLSYTYTLEQYASDTNGEHGTLFYTRHTTQNSSEYLFSVKDSLVSANNWNAVIGNADSADRILNDGSKADSFKFIFDANGDVTKVLTAENSTITVNNMTDGKLATELSHDNGYFRIVTQSSTILFVDGNYLYYSTAGGNGYTFNRIDYTGGWRDYEALSVDGTVTEYTPVKIYDLDSVNDWYMPEFINGQLLFASETDSMSTYNYIMACDLNGANGIMNNTELSKLTDKFNDIIGKDGIIKGYEDTDDYPSKTYANLANAARYLFYTSDYDYVKNLAAACNAELDDDDDLIYSDETLALLQAFLKPAADNDWADYTDTRNVNGKTVYANVRDYYYGILGKMTDSHKEALRDDLRDLYLRPYPEAEDLGWYGSLNTAAQVIFIIGMTLCGILVLGGIVVGVILIVRKSRKQDEPQYTKKRIKVDTTDDRSVNVYED